MYFLFPKLNKIRTNDMIFHSLHFLHVFQDTGKPKTIVRTYDSVSIVSTVNVSKKLYSCIFTKHPTTYVHTNGDLVQENMRKLTLCKITDAN